MTDILYIEHPSSSYSPRTYFNANNADLTIAFACDPHTAGERLTKSAAGDKFVGIDLTADSPYDAAKRIELAIDLKLGGRQPAVINVAGNGIVTLSRHGWDQERINRYVSEALSLMATKYLPDLWRSGGQTGVDIAAAVACRIHGWRAEITFPKGFRQLNTTGDVRRSKQDIEDHVAAMADVISCTPGVSTHL